MHPDRSLDVSGKEAEIEFPQATHGPPRPMTREAQGPEESDHGSGEHSSTSRPSHGAPRPRDLLPFPDPHTPHPAYVYEPSVRNAPDADASHLAFVDGSLDELERALDAIGERLVRRLGEVVEALAELCAAAPVESVLAHAETDPDAATVHLAARQAGRTGNPMADACMRALAATGWINFRMRAMLVSFASNHLWLDRCGFAPWLERQFLDYGPGIHCPQVQMRSGTTGINPLRIYSPRKQVDDHDPTGTFVRAWVPELARVPDEFIAEPAGMPEPLQQMVGCRVGSDRGCDSPAPAVEHARAFEQVHVRHFALRATAQARAEARSVHVKHGSRKRSAGRRGS